MRNFAIFLLLANIAWWGWQLFPRRVDPVAAKTIQHTGFIQAEKKLMMLKEVPLELHPEVSAENKTAEVSSQQGLSQATAVNTVAAPAVESVPVSPTPWCGVTNTFGSPENAKKFQTAWLKMAGAAEEELVKELGSSTWWVYLPSSRDEASTQLVLKQLHEKDIDSYYMRSGDLAGGISLGVFSRKGSAVSVQEVIRRKGYAAEVKEIQRMDTKVRITLKLNDREKLDTPPVQQLLGKFGAPPVKEIPCK